MMESKDVCTCDATEYTDKFCTSCGLELGSEKLEIILESRIVRLGDENMRGKAVSLLRANGISVVDGAVICTLKINGKELSLTSEEIDKAKEKIDYFAYEKEQQKGNGRM